MPIWNKQFECMSREEQSQLQLERLQITLNRAHRSVAYYQKLFDKMGIIPERVESLSELSKIPFTNRSALHQSYPYGMFALPLREVVRLEGTTGSIGEPLVVGYTSNDIKHWTEVSARVLSAGGVTREDVVQICFDYDLFGGGLGFIYGAELIGASVIPGSYRDPLGQIMIMQDYRTTALVSTQGFALRLAAAMRKRGIAAASLQLRIGLFICEPDSAKTIQKIEDGWRITVTENYSLAEMAGPPVAAECEAGGGLHIFEDQFIAEIVNPVSGKVLPPGKEGELVLTTIAKEAFPLIRYRTGDITVLIEEPCSCGRTSRRIKKILGRTDDMILVNGIRIFPAQIEKILTEIEGTESRYHLTVDRSEPEDLLEIRVEVSERIFFDEFKKLQELKLKVESEIYYKLGVRAKVKLVEAHSLEQESSS